MSTALTLTKPDNTAIESALILGDLSKLNTEQRLSYYKQVCESVGLNPLTRPFDYITLNGKLTLYAKRDATEQLRKIYSVSITALDKVFNGDLYVVTATAKDATGRVDCSTGAVSIAGLKGEAMANALMKAETKAKRRVTLSICGLGLLDETEVGSIPGATLPPALEEQGEMHQHKPDDVMELSGIILSEKTTDEWVWYELQALTMEGEAKVFVKSPMSTDSGRLAGHIGYGVTLDVRPAGKSAKGGVFLLYDVVKIGKKVQQDDPQTITAEDEMIAGLRDDQKIEKRITKAQEIELHGLRKSRAYPDDMFHAWLKKYNCEHTRELPRTAFDAAKQELLEFVG